MNSPEIRTLTQLVSEISTVNSAGRQKEVEDFRDEVLECMDDFNLICNAHERNRVRLVERVNKKLNG